MINQRKEDYLQILIEEFAYRLRIYVESLKKEDLEQVKETLNTCLTGFVINFDTNQSDMAEDIIRKIRDIRLLEEYAKILLNKYELTDMKEPYQLHVALDIVEYLNIYDNTYSWDRNILKQDLLRLLDKQ